MTPIAREMRTAAAWPDVTPCMKNDALERGADVIEALVGALDAARLRLDPFVERDELFAQIDAALRLAKGGRDGDD